MSIAAKILVADDNLFIRRMLCSLLTEQKHWEIYETKNGRVALERIQQERPDVAVLDIVMPEINGVEAACEIRRLSPKTKIVLISSYYTAQGAAHLARLFGDGNFIQKSETGKQLIPATSRLLLDESQAH